MLYRGHLPVLATEALALLDRMTRVERFAVVFTTMTFATDSLNDS